MASYKQGNRKAKSQDNMVDLFDEFFFLMSIKWYKKIIFKKSNFKDLLY